MKNSVFTDERRQAVELLFTERCSCVVRNGDRIRIFRERGVKDLYRLLQREPALLDGAFVADKVVGKGAAALLILGGVDHVFADIVSRPALDLLLAAGVAVEYTLVVSHILNRAGTGRCPLETRCEGLATARECLVQIEEFMRTQKN